VALTPTPLTPTVPPAPPIEQFLTLRDICSALKVSRVTVWQWRREGRFPEPLVLGANSVRWSESAFRTFLDERSRAPRIERPRSPKAASPKRRRPTRRHR
jgi:prophage regulatory protein